MDERLLYALGDPDRQRVLTVLNERVATAPEIAAETGLELGDVTAQLNVLLAADAVEQVGDESGLSSTFRATIRPFLDDEHWEQLPLETRRALFAMNLRQIADHLEPAVAEGAFDDPRCHVSLTRVDLDQRGWQEIADLLSGVLEEIMDVHAESMERLERGESTRVVPAEVVMLQFRRSKRSRRTAVAEAGSESTRR